MPLQRATLSQLRHECRSSSLPQTMIHAATDATRSREPNTGRKDYADLLPPSWTTIIPQWLAEDTPSFDYGGYVVGEAQEEATLFGKADGVLAGVPFFDAVFRQLECSVLWSIHEGEAILASNGKVPIATVKGRARNLLLGERVALNVLARCSGIATKSRRLLEAARAVGYQGIVAGTRKTTPGFRLIEKYGMLVGGIDAHRYDLSSLVMLKDNHICSQGSITAAVRRCRQASGFALKIEVECTSEAEAIEAVEAGVDIVMLDNFEPSDLRRTASHLKTTFGRSTFLIEVSGGLTVENFAEHVCHDVDIMSTSSAHQSVPHVDFSLKIIPKHTNGSETHRSL